MISTDDGKYEKGTGKNERKQKKKRKYERKMKL
jgi:hypothetical protein